MICIICDIKKIECIVGHTIFWKLFIVYYIYQLLCILCHKNLINSMYSVWH